MCSRARTWRSSQLLLKIIVAISRQKIEKEKAKIGNQIHSIAFLFFHFSIHIKNKEGVYKILRTMLNLFLDLEGF